MQERSTEIKRPSAIPAAAACTRGGFSPELLEYGEVDKDEAHDFLHDFYGGVSV